MNLGLPEAWGKVSFGGDGKFWQFGLCVVLVLVIYGRFVCKR